MQSSVGKIEKALQALWPEARVVREEEVRHRLSLPFVFPDGDHPKCWLKIASDYTEQGQCWWYLTDEGGTALSAGKTSDQAAEAVRAAAVEGVWMVEGMIIVSVEDDPSEALTRYLAAVQAVAGEELREVDEADNADGGGQTCGHFR